MVTGTFFAVFTLTEVFAVIKCVDVSSFNSFDARCGECIKTNDAKNLIINLLLFFSCF